VVSGDIETTVIALSTNQRESRQSGNSFVARRIR
jgi:hypothetical protein